MLINKYDLLEVTSEQEAVSILNNMNRHLTPTMKQKYIKCKRRDKETKENKVLRHFNLDEALQFYKDCEDKRDYVIKSRKRKIELLEKIKEIINGR